MQSVPSSSEPRSSPRSVAPVARAARRAGVEPAAGSGESAPVGTSSSLAPEPPGALDSGVARILAAAGAEAATGAALGERIAWIRRFLAAPPPGTDEALIESLRAAIAETLFEPGMSGDALRALVARSGSAYESALARLVSGESDARLSVRAAARELARTWLGESGAALSSDATLAEIAEVLERAAPRALDVLASASPRADRGELDPRATDALERALRDAPPSAARDVALERVVELASLPNATNSATRAWIDALLGALTAGFGSEREAVVAARVLARDLKFQLLDAAARVADGPLRESLERALAQIEREQLANARSADRNEPVVHTLVARDGGRLSEVRIEFERARDGDSDRGRSPRDADVVARLAVDTAFSELGPVRAEIALRGRSITVVLHAASESTAGALRSAVPEMRTALSLGTRPVDVAVAEVPQSDGAASARAADFVSATLDAWA